MAFDTAVMVWLTCPGTMGLYSILNVAVAPLSITVSLNVGHDNVSEVYCNSFIVNGSLPVFLTVSPMICVFLIGTLPSSIVGFVISALGENIVTVPLLVSRGSAFPVASAIFALSKTMAFSPGSFNRRSLNVMTSPPLPVNAVLLNE